MHMFVRKTHAYFRCFLTNLGGRSIGAPVFKLLHLCACWKVGALYWGEGTDAVTDKGIKNFRKSGNGGKLYDLGTI